jgi:hypothetical protein
MSAKVATLFTTEIDTLHEGTPGRSERLLQLRDKALAARYYYYMKYKHYNYIKACEELSNEFYISVIQVSKVLKANSELLHDLKKEQPTIRQLAGQYKHFNFD